MEGTKFESQYQSGRSEETILSVPSKKPTSNIIKIVVGIVVFAILAAGVSLATRIWDPLWSPFRPEPEEVIDEMSKKMAEVKTLHSKTKFDFLAKEETEEKFKISMDFWSDSDTTEKENPESAGNFYISFGIEGMEFSLAGENRTIDKESYLKLTTIPALPFIEPFLSQIGIDLSQLKNQWIQINEESTKNLLKSLGIPITPEMEEEMRKSEEEQKEMIGKFQAIFEDKKLYLVKRELPDAKIKNQKVYHYLIALNKEEIKKLIPELLQTLTEMQVFPQPLGEAQWQEFEREFPQEFDEFFQKIGDIEGEIFIGKKDFYLYKIQGEKEIDLSKFEAGSKGKFTVKLDMDFSNFNKPVKIEAPTEFKTLEEILKPIFEKMTKEQAYEIVTNDMYIISAKAGLIYSQQGSYANISEDKEIKFFIDEIEKYTGTKPIIHSSKNAYCAYIETWQTITYSQYFCIDSKGFKNTVVVYPGAKSFCDGKTFVCPPPPPF